MPVFLPTIFFLGHSDALLVLSRRKSARLRKIIDNAGETPAEKTRSKSLSSYSSLSICRISVLKRKKKKVEESINAEGGGKNKKRI